MNFVSSGRGIGNNVNGNTADFYEVLTSYRNTAKINYAAFRNDFVSQNTRNVLRRAIAAQGETSKHFVSSAGRSTYESFALMFYENKSHAFVFDDEARLNSAVIGFKQAGVFLCKHVV
ncbi:hypothetical protein D3C86_1956740 [compost metagenome]